MVLFYIDTGSRYCFNFTPSSHFQPLQDTYTRIPAQSLSAFSNEQC